ncbi:MAG: segregation/condensation protein A [Phycisphaerales bacterium]|nr:MAG: segregation/condensation protein A [Phycisphaerales bacterium]
MADYRINLEIFAGPMDLLLYLVRKEEVDIYDIPIAKITDQYLQYVEMLKSLDMELAGDFLVMAATLMEIKSAMLLPKAEPEQLAEDDLTDPRTELIRQLLEYKRFKDAANLLTAAADRHAERFARPDSIVDRLSPDTEPELDIDQVSVWDLLEAFDSIRRATGAVADTRYIKDDTPIDLYQIEILHRLQQEGPMTFENIFESRNNRGVIVGLFLALLELIREKLIWAEQDPSSSQIYVRPLTDEPAEQAVQHAILAVAEASDETRGEGEEPKRPPIAVAEAQQKKEQPALLGIDESQQTPIPIAELPQKLEHASLPQKQEQQGPEAAKSQQQQAGN